MKNRLFFALLFALILSGCSDFLGDIEQVRQPPVADVSTIDLLNNPRISFQLDQELGLVCIDWYRHASCFTEEELGDERMNKIRLEFEKQEEARRKVLMETK